MNKILIIEDDLEINALLADFLKEKGYAVHCQYDGLHVLDFLNKEKINAALKAANLPELKESYYWSSTESSGNYAWILDMSDGCRNADFKGTDYPYVRPVLAL